jgi:glycosyltransferase involved in cell wall biosynthesis
MEKKVDQEILVSIRCLTYNHEPFIAKCLDGFIMQKTSFRFEAIVHDDASTDGTAKIILEYAERFPEIIKPILQTENQYSKGRKISRLVQPYLKGKYIAVCEGDDYWIDPEKLQKQVDFMESNKEYSMCFHNSFIFDSNCKKIIGNHKIYNKSQDAEFQHILQDGGFVPTQSKLYRKESMIGFDQFPQNCPVGDLKNQTYLALTGKVFYLNETMAVYRRWEGSFTRSISRDVERYVAHHKKFIDWYRSVDAFYDGRFHQEIDNAIAFSEARIAIALKDYKKLKNKRYKRFIAYKRTLPRIGLYANIYGFSWIFPLGLKIQSLFRRFRRY